MVTWLASSMIAGCARVTPLVPTKGAGNAASAPSVYEELRSSDLTNLDTREDDCDGNDVTDSLDIANGYADDSNHNHIPDICEPTSLPGSYMQDFSEWSRVARAADSLDMRRVFGSRVGYAIQCFIPKSAGSGRLLVRERGGKELAVISECVPEGPSRYYWPLRGSNGLLAEPDREYSLSLEAGTRQVRRALRWGRNYASRP
jgi:hypothetical protein